MNSYLPSVCPAAGGSEAEGGDARVVRLARSGTSRDAGQTEGPSSVRTCCGATATRLAQRSLRSGENGVAVAAAFLHARFDGDAPAYQLVDVMPVEVRQKIGDFSIERVREKGDEPGGDIAAAGFPIREHVARDGDVESVQRGGENVLRLAAVLSESAKADANLIEGRAHTRMVGCRLVRTVGLVVCFSVDVSVVSSEGEASTWLGAWFFVRSSFSSISLCRRVNSW